MLLVGLVFLGNAVWSALHQRVPFSLILIVLFMSSYVLVDGLYLLLAGISFVFTTAATFSFAALIPSLSPFSLLRKSLSGGSDLHDI